MLNKDYANTILNANRLGLSLDFSPVPNKWEKLPQVVSQGISDWDKVQKTNAYVNALQGGNQDEINQAWSAYDPQGFANYQQDQARRAEERQWHLDDLEAQRQFQRDLLRDKLNNEFALAKYKAGLGGGSTNAQQNVAAMIEAGYTPQEAWAMYYGGNNPTLDMATLGQKGQEQLGKETAKNYAEDLNSYNNMVSKMPELEETVKQLGELGKNATYTTAGQALDLFRRQSGLDPRQSAVDRASYISMIDNQVLPLLRDTFGAAFTEREGNTLRKTLGDPNTTPAEKQAQLDAFIRQKQKSIESQARKLESYSRPSLKQFNQTPSDDDAWGGI